jgi:hypothetical protein
MTSTVYSPEFLPFGLLSDFDIRASDLHPEHLAYCRTRQWHLVRLGFALDADTKPGKLVFNRTITLKDAWAKEVKKGIIERERSHSEFPKHKGVTRKCAS